MLLRVPALFRLAADFFFADDFEREGEPERDDVFVFAFDLAFVALFDVERAVEAFDFARDFVVDLVFDFAFVVDFDLERDELFAFDLAFVFVFAFAFDFAFEREPLEREAAFLRAPLFRVLLVRRDAGRCAEPSPCSSSPSSSDPISFLATPTAAGIATPSAVPATTFCVVERPSSSSFDMLTSRAPASRLRASAFTVRR